MALNELFRRTGEPTYHTPIAVIGELVNQSGGQVTIINPPFRSKPRVWRKGWAKKFKFGKLYFYISNCRMKKRPIRDLMYDGAAQDHVVENKHKLYERQGDKCFDSIADAARFVKGAPGNIVKCLKGQIKTAYSYGWKYVD